MMQVNTLAKTVRRIANIVALGVWASGTGVGSGQPSPPPSANPKFAEPPETETEAVRWLMTPEPALKQVGKSEVLMEMIVRKAKDRLENRGIIYFDSEDDFKYPKNLSVAISVEVASKWKQKGIADSAAHFQGKRIRVHGCVMQFEQRHFVPVLDVAQITIVERK